jgi:hypothetical protein
MGLAMVLHLMNVLSSVDNKMAVTTLTVILMTENVDWHLPLEITEKDVVVLLGVLIMTFTEFQEQLMDHPKAFGPNLII